MEGFASRVNTIRPAAPFVIGNLVAALEEDGADIVDLSVGQPDFPTPDNIVEAAKAALDAGHTTYTPSNGISALRRAIAERKLGERDGLDYGPEHVIVTPGGKHALYETVMALVEAGDEVVLIDPCGRRTTRWSRWPAARRSTSTSRRTTSSSSPPSTTSPKPSPTTLRS